MAKSPSLLYLLTGLTVVLLMGQCQSKKVAQPPRAEGFDPPIPPALSYVAGSITFQLKELAEKINKELNPVLVGKQSEDGKAKGIISFRVKRLGDVQVHYTDHQVNLSAPLQMWLTKPFSNDTTPPEKPFCVLDVHFKTPVSVTSNWRLASHTTFANYKWIIEPEIRLLGKGISLTNIAERILEKHRSDIEMAIDSAIYKELRLDKMVRPIWHDLQDPLLIDKAYGLWLMPKPVSIAAGQVSGDKQQLTVPVRIAFETKTELKPKAPVPAKTQLPMLQKREEISQTSDLYLMSFIPYTDINRMLELTVNKQDKKLALGSLTIKHVSVYGAQRDLIVKTEIDGLLDGAVYLRGRPVFDTLSNTLHITNLDFDAETGKVLSKGSDAVLHGGIQKLLENLLTIPLGDDIAQFPKKINEAFEEGGAGKKTDMDIKSFRFTPQKIAIRPDGIQTLIQVESKVAVKVNKL